MRPIRLMYLILLSALIVAACGTPNSVQIPVTQGATLPAPTIAAPLIAVPGLASIQMIDARNGWGITDTTVVRSDDGGVSWHKVGPAAVTSLGFSATSDFLDALHGWFLISDTKNPAVGMLYWTSDGGVTWTSAVVPFGSGDLHFLDANKGWIMASLGAAAGSMGVAIFQTTDGGKTWTQTYTNVPTDPGAGSSLPLGGLKDGMTAVDMQTAFIGGVTYTPGTIYLYKTPVPGHSLNPISVQVPLGLQPTHFVTLRPKS